MIKRTLEGLEWPIDRKINHDLHNWSQVVSSPMGTKPVRHTDDPQKIIEFMPYELKKRMVVKNE